MDMKENVIVVNYMGRHGSGNIHAYVMVKAMLEEGESVVAVVSKYADNINSWRALDLTELIEVETYQNVIQFAYRSVAFYMHEAKNIARHLKESYDILAIYNPMMTYWTFGLNRHLKNCKIITCNHDPIPHSGDRRKWSFEKALKQSRIIIVHSRQFIEYVREHYPESRVEYMPLTRLNVYDMPGKIKTVSYDSNKINFLFFGTISEYKGLGVLADAYRIAKKECPNITLTIGGNGDFSPYQETYDKLNNGDIFIVNRWIADEEVESFFDGKQLILILPYTDATQSGVALVAREYGIPIIATKTGGLPEQIEDGKTGLLVEPSDADELSKAMITLATNRDLINNMKKNISDRQKENEDGVLAKQLLAMIKGK